MSPVVFCYPPAAMNSIPVCFVTSELSPYVKAGGLADVSAALPAALQRAGHQVKVIVPLYGSIDPSAHALRAIPELGRVPIALGRHQFHFEVVTGPSAPDSPEILFVHCPPLYGRPELYTSHPDEHLRFILLSRAALEICQRLSFSPRIVHCHDWQTALVPVYLKSAYAWDKIFSRTRSVLTIHNLGYQGVFGNDVLPDLAFPDHERWLDREDLLAGRVNFLKTGIRHADFLTTVSPTYAREIQTESQGMQLDDLLRARSGSLEGILNGVDYASWSPGSDTVIPRRYSAENLDLKYENRQVLLEAMGLHPAPSPAEAGRAAVPVIGIVSRMAYQKGIDLLAAAVSELLQRYDLRLAALGTGEPRYEELLLDLERRHPGRVRFYNGYHERLAHLIEAGSDLFAMPSRYEPCGLNQMYSLRYGTVPVVRRTGGLADTVSMFDPEMGTGTGFVFDHFTADGLVWAFERAFEVFRHPGLWRRLMLNGMAEDWSWTSQAAQYETLYRRVLGER